MTTRSTLLSALMTLALASWATTNAFLQQNPEIATSVDDGFTIATVGDLIYAHDLGHMMTDPSFAGVVDLLRQADVATGNLEGIIVDGRTFTGSRMGGHGAEPGAADSLKDMGFDLVARPNNHGNDFGPEGVAETSAHLDRVGVKYAGVGNTYAAARAARFYTATRGRVGMVATSATGTLPARPARGEFPGSGGYSTLDVTRFFMMPAASWNAVQTVRDHFPNGAGFYARGANRSDQIALLGQQFRKAPASETEPVLCVRDEPAGSQGRHRSGARRKDAFRLPDRRHPLASLPGHPRRISRTGHSRSGASRHQPQRGQLPRGVRARVDQRRGRHVPRDRRACGAGYRDL